MPTSAKTFDKEVQELLEKYVSKGMTKFLDVGAGSGKYGKMLSSMPVWDYTKFQVDAIEPEEQYRIDYRLKGIYSNIFGFEVQKFIGLFPSYCANVVIFGDVLEHLPKSAGIDVLEHFIYRSNFIIVVVPKSLVQFSKEEYTNNEDHNSIWHPAVLEAYRGTVKEKNNKILATIPGFFNYPDAVISKSSYEIMKEQGCTRFRGTILDRG